MGMEQYRLKGNPLCNPAAVLQGSTYRISILTESLIRLEYSPKGCFEDRATQIVVNRNFPVPEFQVTDGEGELVVKTRHLELFYDKKPFSARGLRIRTKVENRPSFTWNYGQETWNLGGTARTLDETNGAIPLENGLLSRNGCSVVDDSHTMALMEDGWVAAREQENIDIYFFGYGLRYLECLKDFYHLCGRTPLLPRYALGNWWSRYHRYTQDEYKELIERFESERLPFAVAVVDMDWHLVDGVDPEYGSGWTGYTWNKELFPDHKEFLQWLHAHQLKVTLNVHPADGIRAFEEAYQRVAKALGKDPEKGEAVEFDPTDPAFMEVYFKELHHPLEEEGVDFWWLDWQQGTQSKIPGLDPLWMLNHYHYLDSGWKGSRPITFSRYAGIGSHRYPIGFSGDTTISWESLDFQPYFTATASNIGFGWWSHDIGGHMWGVRDDELMTRWVQYGVFSPINRLHSTNNPFSGKEPWKYDTAAREVIGNYLRLRHSLIPYLYTMNRRASREGQPLVQPLYYREPEREEAYHVPNEYYFGSGLLVSPITRKQNPVGRAAEALTWLPEGLWADFFSGMIYQGGRIIKLWRGLEHIPVLMREGAIVPMRDTRITDNSADNPGAMEVRIFPAADGSFTLWEDSGDTPSDEDENWVSTEMEIATSPQDRFRIGRAKGNLAAIPDKRSWKLIFVGVAPAKPFVSAEGKAVDAAISYDQLRQSLIVEIPETSVTQEIMVDFREGLFLTRPDRNRRCYQILERAQMDYGKKMAAYSLIERMGKDSVASLMALGLDESVMGQLCEILG